MKNTGKIIIILMVLSFTFLASTCVKEDENHHRKIGMINNSKRAIYTHFSVGYPDTLDMYGVPSSSEPSIYKVEPQELNTTALWQRTFWEVIFKGGRRIPSDTLMVFIMDAELLESHSTHIKNVIIQRYDLSLEDLQRVNWVLSYPPNENMRKIKMYPLYKGK